MEKKNLGTEKRILTNGIHLVNSADVIAFIHIYHESHLPVTTKPFSPHEYVTSTQAHKECKNCVPADDIAANNNPPEIRPINFTDKVAEVRVSFLRESAKHDVHTSPQTAQSR